MSRSYASQDNMTEKPLYPGDRNGCVLLHAVEMIAAALWR